MYKINGKITNIEKQNINTDNGDFVKKACNNRGI